MKPNSLWLGFPGGYYLLTRYKFNYQRIIYLLKYWVPFLTLVFFLSSGITIEQWLFICISIIIFFNIYDWFSFENDQVVIQLEKKPISRGNPNSINKIEYVKNKILIAVSLNIICLALKIPFTIFLLQVLLITVFYIHNRIKPSMRPASYFLLYVLKGYFVGYIFSPELDICSKYIFFVFVVLYAATYLPKYIYRKIFSGEIEGKSLGLRIFLQPIVYKNVFILLFSLIYTKGLWILLFVDLFTAVELVWGKYQKTTWMRA